MEMNNTVMYIIIGLLLVLVAILFVRIFQYKKQMRLFTERINKRKQEDVNQTVTVEYFDKDIVDLAMALNEYTDLIKNKTLQIEDERRQLKNVIAGISHDFRTPLTAAKGYMQLIKKTGNLDEKNQEYLDIALAKTDYLKVLSDAFFEVSSLEAKNEEVEIAEVNVTKLLSEICLGQYEGINERGLATKIKIPEQDVYVRSNEEMLKRIFENFFSNALKYSKTYLNIDFVCGKSAGNNGPGESGECVEISFANDIDAETIIDTDHVFDAFYRDASRHSEGAGLGLYVVKCLTEKLGHTVEAKCENGVFSVILKMG